MSFTVDNMSCIDQLEPSIFDRYYRRCDTLDLLGSAAGRRILDAGCGNGTYAVDLARAGADVIGIDQDERAIERARSLAGASAVFRVADITKSLKFLGIQSFDAVLCSLVLHYIEDWTVPLDEFMSLLKPGGRLVVSCQHPFADYSEADSTDYFKTEPWSESGDNLIFWRRPLEDVLESILNAGFMLSAVREPRPRTDVSHAHTGGIPRLLVIQATST